MIAEARSSASRGMVMRVFIWLCAIALGGIAHAQPTTFFNAGTFDIPGTPAYASEYVSEGEFLVYDDPPVDLVVQWVRFTITTPVQGYLYLDFDARVYSPGIDITYALYGPTGNLIASDSGTGGFPVGGGAGLSFGSTAERVPFANRFLRGQHGSLDAGTYWFAVIAGGPGEVTLAPTNWGVSTTASYPLGYEEGELFMEAGIIAGNTIPLPPPSNDDCANALIIGENQGASPAWQGSNIGATEDGQSPCYPDLENVTTKDVWFRYIPSVTGWAQAVATGGAGGGALPILTRYEGDCGSAPARCSGGGAFVPTGGIRLRFTVVAGEPVLLGLAVRAGAWGPLRLDVHAVGGPCDLETPAGALTEIEGPCDTGLNNGCGATPQLFETLTIGRAVSGTLFSTVLTRDTDAFRFTIPTAQSLPLAFRARLPVQVQIVRASTNPAGCSGQSVLLRRTLDIAPGCEPVLENVNLTAGQYILAITPTFQDDIPCGDWIGEYWLALGEIVPACDPDFNADGNVDQDDIACLAQLVAGDPSCSSNDPDFNADGNVDQDDIDALAQVVAGAECP